MRSIVMRCAVVAAAASITVGLSAQRPDGELRFEVASVKPCAIRDAATPEEFMRLLNGVPPGPGRYYQPCTTVRELALFAYGLPLSRVRDTVKSLDFFEVNALAGRPVTLEEMRLMVRHLLADRFAFRSHTEVATLDVSTLVLAQPDGRLGPGAQPAAIDCSPTELEVFDDKRRVHCEGVFGSRDGVMTRTLKGITMSRFAEVLLGREVIVDGTGLKGVFDLTFSYDIRTVDVDLPAGVSDNGPRDRALERQLGLRLIRSKGPVEILVIDSFEQPTPN